MKKTSVCEKVDVEEHIINFEKNYIISSYKEKA